MKERRNYIAFLILLFGLVLLLRPSPKKTSVSSQSQSSINSELKAADISIRHNEAIMRELNQKVQQQAKTSGVAGRPRTSMHLQLSQESHAIQVAEESRQNDLSNRYLVRNVDEAILRSIATEQFANRYDETYRSAYINAFLQNARDNGVEVILNEDLEVIDVTPFTIDEPMRFPDSTPNSSRGSQ